MALPRGLSVTLEQCLLAHFGEAPLENSPCTELGCLARSRRETTLPHRWPRVLVIQLKRWIDIGGGVILKEKRAVSLQSMIPAGLIPGQPLYHLESIIMHHGPSGGGHYTCFASSATSPRAWYHYDDSAVPCRVTEDIALTQALDFGWGDQSQVYMLAYSQWNDHRR